MIASRAAHDVLGGMLQVLGQFGAVPRNAVWDQEGCIGAWRQGRQVLTREFQAFRGTLGMGAILCGPADPEAKGVAELHAYMDAPGMVLRCASCGAAQLRLVRSGDRAWLDLRGIQVLEVHGATPAG